MVRPGANRDACASGRKPPLVRRLPAGQRAAHLLLEEVQRGGVVDSSHQVSETLQVSIRCT